MLRFYFSIHCLNTHMAVEHKGVRHAVAREAHGVVAQQLNAQQVAQRVVLLFEYEGSAVWSFTVGSVGALAFVLRILMSPYQKSLRGVGHYIYFE